MVPIRALALCTGLSGPAFAQAPLALSQIWTPPAVSPGLDTPLYLTIDNAGPADALLRVRCASANFAELHMLDRGEGFPSMRPVRQLPIVAQGVTRLSPEGPHVMLLQTTHALAPGDHFGCSIVFRDAGKQDVTALVGKPE